MSSRRLPGKVLGDVAGRPLLAWLIERLRHAEELDVLVLATSVEAADDPVAAFAEAQGVEVHRGALEDVAQRFRDGAREHRLDAFARVNGDSPLLDQRLVDRAVRMFRDGSYDLVTNVLPRTYPTGESIEVVDAGTYADVYEEITEAGDRENVTPFLYRNPDRFRIGTFHADPPYEGVRLAVDTEEDLRRAEVILNRMDRPHWEYGVDEIVALYRAAA